MGWAGSTVLAPAESALEAEAFTYVTVVDTEVGSSINLNVVAQWTPTLIGANQAAGVVTSVDIVPGQEVTQGNALYTVNLRPVVIARGSVPAFHSMSLGASGADVAQLQTMLAELGFYPYAVDGQFDWVTQEAVTAWQASLGIEADGVVQQGDIVFVPTLPTRVSLGEAISRGASLGGGEPLIEGLPPTPEFGIPVSDRQAAVIPTSTAVEITGPDGSVWTGSVTGQTSSEEDGIVLTVQGEEGAAVCGSECGEVPLAGPVSYPARIVTVEPTRGPTVPTAALLSNSDGSIAVIDDDGVEVRVTVVASARGMSVVSGVPTGTLVRVPGRAER